MGDIGRVVRAYDLHLLDETDAPAEVAEVTQAKTAEVVGA